MANKIWPATSLTGGGDQALDGIDGNSLSDKDMGFTVDSDYFYAHTLKASSGAAESSPDVIKPDANAGDKRWHLVYMYAIDKLPFDADYKTYLLQSR